MRIIEKANKHFTLFVIPILIIGSILGNNIIENSYATQHSEEVIQQPFSNFTFTLESPEKYFEEITTNLAAGSTIYDLALYIFGMVVYAIFVWHFYRFIAKREILPVATGFRDESGNFSAKKISLYVAGHIFLFPFIIWIWFMVYSFFMFVLAKDMPLGVILLISISVIGATRITSYYREDLAKDVGKLLPFALLGVFLTSSAFFSETTNFFSLQDFENRIEEIPQFISRIVEFVTLVVAIEIILRISFLIKRKIRPAAEEKLEEQIEEQIDEKIKVKVQEIEKEQDKLEEKIEKSEDKLEEKIEKSEDNLEEKIDHESKK